MARRSSRDPDLTLERLLSALKREYPELSAAERKRLATQLLRDQRQQNRRSFAQRAQEAREAPTFLKVSQDGTVERGGDSKPKSG